MPIDVGDAVIPRSVPDHDVMTVYDLKGPNYSVALCNWIVGNRMLKAEHPVSTLTKLQRRERTGG